MQRIIFIITLVLACNAMFAQQEDLNQKLIEACKQKQFVEAISLIEQGADIFSDANSDYTPAYIYIYHYNELYDAMDVDFDAQQKLFMLTVQKGINLFKPVETVISEFQTWAVEDWYDTYYFDTVVGVNVEFVPFEIIAQKFNLQDFEQIIIENIKSSDYKNAIGFNGNTALHYASIFGNSKNIAETLIENGADVNAKNNDALTPLYYADQNLEAAKLLIEKGAEVNIRFNQTDSTPSVMFRYLYNLENQPELVSDTDDFNPEKSVKNTEEIFDVILLAAQHGFNVFESVSSVINDTITIYNDETWYVEWEIKDTIVSVPYDYLPYETIVKNQKLTDFEPIIISNISQGHYKILDQSNGNTALHYASSIGQSFNIVDALIKNGADVNAKNTDGLTPFLFAINPSLVIYECDTCEPGNLKIARLLIENGADIAVSENASNPSAAFYLLNYIENPAVSEWESTGFNNVEYSKKEILDLIVLAAKNGFNVFKTIVGELRFNETFVVTDIYGEDIFFDSIINQTYKYLPFRIIVENNKLTDFEQAIVNDIAVGNYKDTIDNGNTALHYACAIGNSFKIVDALIKSGCNVNAKNLDGFSPIYGCVNPYLIIEDCDSCSSGNLDIIKLLIENGADLTPSDKYYLPSVMFYLFYSLDNKVMSNSYLNPSKSESSEIFDVIKCATQKGFNVFNPLFFEVMEIQQFVQIDEIGEMIAYDSLVYSSMFLNPFEIIVKNNQLVQFEPMICGNIKNGAYGNTVYPGGNTALHYACETGNSVKIVKSLIKKGADVNAKNKDNSTPLHLAAMNKDGMALVKILVSKKADVLAKDLNGKTPVELAKEAGNEGIVEFLIKLEK